MPRFGAGLLAFCWALAFAGYASSLSGEFVFDDRSALLHDDCYRGLDRVPAMFALGSTSSCANRPVRSASFALDHAIWGLDPFGYHLTNVLLHGVVTLLLGLLVIQLGGCRRAAVLAAALYALHPIGTEAVAYISGRRDLLAALFALLCARLYFGYRDRGGVGRLIGAVACFVLALGSHEIVAAVPAALALIDLGRTASGDTVVGTRAALRRVAGSRRAWLALGSMAALVVAYGAFKIFGANPSQRDALWGPDLAAHVGTVLRVHAHYLKQLVYPVPLIADYSEEAFAVSSSLLEPRALLAGVLVLGLVGVALWRFSRAPLAWSVALSYLVLLLPVSQIVLHHELLAEHRLYLPAACFVGLLGWGLDRGIARWGSTVWGLAGALLLTYALLTNSRNLDWRSEETLWARTVEDAPRCARALGNLGTQLLERGKVQRARELLQRAVAIRPELCAARVNLGEALLRSGEEKRGLALIEQGSCLPPSRRAYRLGRAYSMLGRWRDAAAAYRRAIAIGPPRASYHRGLAEALQQLRDRGATRDR